MKVHPVVWLSVIALMVMCPAGVWAQDLASRLQAVGLTPDGQVQQAADLRSLFQAINGGAESYIKYGFSKASLQTYKAKDGKTINVDLFEMKDPAAAKAVYTEKAGQSGQKLEIKDEGVLKEYYLMFRQGRFFIVLIGETTDPQAINKLTATARIIERWFAEYGKKPLF